METATIMSGQPVLLGGILDDSTTISSGSICDSDRFLLPPR
jgi:hypothetical protein